MCTRANTETKSTPSKPPPYVLALQDYDPHQSQAVYDKQPPFTVPDISNQLSFNRGEVLRVVSDVLDWWILCEKAETKQQGYVATKCFAPICSSPPECVTEGISDENDKKKMVPCVKEEYVDLSYFPNTPNMDGVNTNKKPSPMESANIFSRVTFWWMTGLILTGYRRPLTDSDIWDLSRDNVANHVVSKFQEKWQKQIKSFPKKTNGEDSIGSSCDSGIENKGEDTEQIEMEIVKSEKGPGEESKSGIIDTEGAAKVEIKDGKSKERVPSMWRTLAQCFGSTFLFAAVMKLLHDSLVFVNPYLLRLIIQYIEGRGPQETWRGYILALGLFIVATFQSMVLHQYFDKAVIVGMRARSAILGIVYRKMLKLSSKGRQVFTSGEMVNLMSVDATKFQDITTYLNMVWSAPFQILATLFFLYDLMGWSIFAGVGTMSLLLPINYVVSNKIKSAQTKLMKQKDQRTKIMNDVLSGMKVLKLYAWEESFQKQITSLRSRELKLLRSVSLWRALVSFAFTCAPFLVSLATFAVYVMIGNELNAEKAFVAISLFNILQFPLTILPMIVTRIIACKVSVKRLTGYLQADELDENSVNYSTSSDHPVAVKIEHGSFTWDEKSEFMLKNISFEAGRGSLIAIVGQVGSGKSSIISALLGEMQKKHGTVTVNGTVAYVPQQAWIQNATVESNILFGKPFNAKKYKRVLEACALESDLKILPAGDLTEIGEKGINLSGGQKQRVSIARALYNGADIYFLDDPLSAVDAHVALHLFDNVIGPQGLMRNKVRILVTHSLSLLSQVDKIIVLKNGSISEVGTYEELVSSSSSYAELLRSFGDDADNDDIDGTEDSPLARSATKRQSILSFGSRQPDALERVLDMKEHLDKQMKKEEKGQKVVEAETVQTGTVSRSVFAAYAKSIGIATAIFVLFFGLCSKFFLVGTRIWLADWSSKNSVSSEERDKYLMIYGLLGLGHCVSTYLSSILLTIGAYFAAKRLHDNLLINVLRCPMQFFESTPMGRLTNRFTKDINVIDEDVPETVNSFIGCLFGIVSVIFTISYSTVLFLAALVPLAAIYIGTQRFYVASSRQLKRLESIRRSPIYNHFFESINGVSSIRAQRQQERFINENERRIDENQAAFAPSNYSNRWLAVRLEFVGNMIIFLSALFAIIGKDSITAGLAGLSISYAMQITQTLNWFVRMTSKLETDIVAVERVKEYSEVETEAARINPDNRPDASWPDKGVVDVQNYCARYRKDLDYALHHISFDIKPCEKVGVVGRTGAGKSSLAMGLFRMIEAAEGSITIDGINISDIGLMDLRSRLTIIPQDPVLFSGSIRFNLDPFDQHSDDSIWNALEISHLKGFIDTLNGGLQEPVAESGSNFSVGQRQLMCLARAILRKSKILVLDEATAAVDMETDEFIQKTIRDEFKDCTVFTIAHRLNTVIDYDRILVLDKGKVVEFDSPQKLLQSKGMFYDMAKDANIL